MLSGEEIVPGSTFIITGENCCSQYKSAKTFYHLNNICNKYNINIIGIYGVAGHGKNEVDTVGGVSKIAISCITWTSYF